MPALPGKMRKQRYLIIFEKCTHEITSLSWKWTFKDSPRAVSVKPDLVHRENACTFLPSLLITHNAMLITHAQRITERMNETESRTRQWSTVISGSVLEQYQVYKAISLSLFIYLFIFFHCFFCFFCHSLSSVFLVNSFCHQTFFR